jgi:predicted nucleic acid-binding protein
VLIYVDSSALLKRVFAEPESQALLRLVRSCVDDGTALVTSSLAWVEVSRAVRTAELSSELDVDDLVEAALSGVLEKPITAEVVALARRLRPAALRSLDAIHLASALLLDVDAVLTYDRRLLDASGEHRVRTLTP